LCIWLSWAIQTGGAAGYVYPWDRRHQFLPKPCIEKVDTPPDLAATHNTPSFSKGEISLPRRTWSILGLAHSPSDRDQSLSLAYDRSLLRILLPDNHTAKSLQER